MLFMKKNKDIIPIVINTTKNIISIKCIDNKKFENHLTLNKVYLGEDISNIPNLFELIDDTKSLMIYKKDRFKLNI